MALSERKMEEQREKEQKLEQQKLEHFRETMDRLTAVSHVQIEYFAEHKKLEGYHESRASEQFFNCDRLMKQDNMFGTLQLGYNPNRGRVFFFANMKTSRYDTVASSYQKEMSEDMKRSMLKGENANRAYLSKRWENAAVLVEKRDNMPWSQRSIRTYMQRANADSLQKTMPFFAKEEERREAKDIREKQRKLQEDIRSIRISQAKNGAEVSREEQRGMEEQLRQLRRESVESLTMENLLQAITIRKSAMSKSFFRRLNYAFDYQKKDIEAYYRERKKALEQNRERAASEAEPEDEEE